MSKNLDLKIRDIETKFKIPYTITKKLGQKKKLLSLSDRQKEEFLY